MPYSALLDGVPSAFSGQRLRALRLARGLTQAELAHRAHVRERQIIRWEREQHAPRLAAVASLAQVLDVPFTELFDSHQAEEDDDMDPAAALVHALERYVDARFARADAHSVRNLRRLSDRTQPPVNPQQRRRLN